MRKNAMLQALFVLIWAIALLHVAAEYYYLYWMYRWFDIPMHFLGGLWVGLAMLWVCFRSGYVPPERAARYRPFVVAVVGGMLIGLVWELYEYVVWVVSGKGLPLDYVPDSLLDLVMDFLGTLVAHASFVIFGDDAVTSTKTPA
jgi:hypothetical protein